MFQEKDRILTLTFCKYQQLARKWRHFATFLILQVEVLSFSSETCSVKGGPPRKRCRPAPPSNAPEELDPAALRRWPETRDDERGRYPVRNLKKSWRPSLLDWRPSPLVWRPSLVGWGASLLGWRPSLVGCRPSLVGWRPSLLDWRPSP